MQLPELLLLVLPLAILPIISFYVKYSKPAEP